MQQGGGAQATVKLLHEKGASAIVENNACPQDKVEGKTPLHYAAGRGVQATVKVLLEKGANAVIADQQGRLPQDLASGKIHMLLMKEAEKQGGSTPLARWGAFTVQNCHCVACAECVDWYP